MRRFLKKYLPDPSAITDNRWLRPFRSSLLHPRLWHLNRHSAAGAVAAGLFCGLIPGPLQMLGAAVCALLFRTNLPLAMLVTLYTNPLTLPPLYIVAYEIGRRLVDGQDVGWPPGFTPDAMLAWAEAMQTWMMAAAKPLALGLVVLASSLALSGYFLTYLLWRLYLIKAWRQRRQRRCG